MISGAWKYSCKIKKKNKIMSTAVTVSTLSFMCAQSRHFECSRCVLVFTGSGRQRRADRVNSVPVPEGGLAVDLSGSAQVDSEWRARSLTKQCVEPVVTRQTKL